MQAKFIGGLNKQIPHLINFISQGNSQQTGIPLTCFVRLVNQHSAYIQRVTLMDTCYLHRHYHPDYHLSQHTTGPDTDKLWALRNHEALSTLQVDWDLTSWAAVIHDTAYADCLAQVNDDYNHDTAFAEQVNAAVTQHQAKGTPQAAQDYLLEECAGSLLLANSGATLTYPSDLNLAVRYTLKKHLTDYTGITPYFLGYRLKNRPKAAPELAPYRSQFWQKPVVATDTVQQNSQPTTDLAHDHFSTTLSDLITHSLPSSPELRSDFLSELMRLCRRYRDNNPPTDKEFVTWKNQPH